MVEKPKLRLTVYVKCQHMGVFICPSQHEFCLLIQASMGSFLFSFSKIQANVSKPMSFQEPAASLGNITLATHPLTQPISTGTGMSYKHIIWGFKHDKLSVSNYMLISYSSSLPLQLSRPLQTDDFLHSYYCQATFLQIYTACLTTNLWHILSKCGTKKGLNFKRKSPERLIISTAAAMSRPRSGQIHYTQIVIIN